MNKAALALFLASSLISEMEASTTSPLGGFGDYGKAFTDPKDYLDQYTGATGAQASKYSDFNKFNSAACQSSIDKANQGIAQLLTDVSAAASQLKVYSDLDTLDEASFYLKSICAMEDLQLDTDLAKKDSKVERKACADFSQFLGSFLGKDKGFDFRSSTKAAIQLAREVLKIGENLGECKVRITRKSNETEAEAEAEEESPVEEEASGEEEEAVIDYDAKIKEAIRRARLATKLGKSKLDEQKKVIREAALAKKIDASREAHIAAAKAIKRVKEIDAKLAATKDDVPEVMLLDLSGVEKKAETVQKSASETIKDTLSQQIDQGKKAAEFQHEISKQQAEKYSGFGGFGIPDQIFGVPGVSFLDVSELEENNEEFAWEEEAYEGCEDEEIVQDEIASWDAKEVAAWNEAIIQTHLAAKIAARIKELEAEKEEIRQAHLAAKIAQEKEERKEAIRKAHLAERLAKEKEARKEAVRQAHKAAQLAKEIGVTKEEIRQAHIAKEIEQIPDMMLLQLPEGDLEAKKEAIRKTHQAVKEKEARKEAARQAHLAAHAKEIEEIPDMMLLELPEGDLEARKEAIRKIHHATKEKEAKKDAGKRVLESQVRKEAAVQAHVAAKKAKELEAKKEAIRQAHLAKKADAAAEKSNEEQGVLEEEAAEEEQIIPKEVQDMIDHYKKESSKYKEQYTKQAGSKDSSDKDGADKNFIKEYAGKYMNSQKEEKSTEKVSDMILLALSGFEDSNEEYGAWEEEAYEGCEEEAAEEEEAIPKEIQEMIAHYKEEASKYKEQYSKKESSKDSDKDGADKSFLDYAKQYYKSEKGWKSTEKAGSKDFILSF